MDNRDSETLLAKGTGREWIITNGLGGYASSTAIGMNTRKYHGLLVAAINPPVHRRVMLSSLDEEIQVGSRAYQFAAHQYPGTLHPQGDRHLEDFSTEPFPEFRYFAEDVSVRKKITMVHGENTVVVRYDISNPVHDSIIFRVLPLVNNRDIHKLTRSGELQFKQHPHGTGTVLDSKEGKLYIGSDIPFTPKAYWYYNMEYMTELSRGYPYREDNFNPGYFETEVGRGESSFFIAASTSGISLDMDDIDRIFSHEMQRRNQLTEKQAHKDDFINRLTRAADSFIVRRQSTGSRSIIAGYHWYSDWGRDSMISLPGLTLVTGRFGDARNILATFAASCSEGLIPNFFPESPSGEIAYNTVDASLWFVQSLRKYLDYTGDLEFISGIWDTVENIIDYYCRGTKHDIRMEADGLISQGGQLTWMDVKVRGRELTSRRGKTCEINALWYNALLQASAMGEQLGKDTSAFYEIAELTKENFEGAFWNGDKGCLYDCIPCPENPDDTEPACPKDASVRPNQVLAVSLPFTMLPSASEKSIMQVVKDELLTPYGLRTLSPSDPFYMGVYRGDAEGRDTAYHNGTVWPWLLGPYITAYIKVNGHSNKSRDEMRSLLKGMEVHLEKAGIGTISEVFDGDTPHRPGGTISQAWSVAEILRAYVEDIGTGDLT